MAYYMKIFDENGQEIGGEAVCMNEDRFQQYIDEHGLERAQGYRDGFKDLFYDLHRCKALHNTPQRMGTQAKKFLARNEVVLSRVEKLLGISQSTNDSLSDQKYNP